MRHLRDWSQKCLTALTPSPMVVLCLLSFLSFLLLCFSPLPLIESLSVHRGRGIVLRNLDVCYFIYAAQALRPTGTTTRLHCSKVYFCIHREYLAFLDVLARLHSCLGTLNLRCDTRWHLCLTLWHLCLSFDNWSPGGNLSFTPSTFVIPASSIRWTSLTAGSAYHCHTTIWKVGAPLLTKPSRATTNLLTSLSTVIDLAVPRAVGWYVLALCGQRIPNSPSRSLMVSVSHHHLI
jgi:hypothetical protein